MSAFFFDLDGTITDSAPGIISCVNYGLTSLGASEAAADRIRAMIGTPLTLIYEALLPGINDAQVHRAIAAYQERYDEVGLVENRLFPGVEAALQACREQGHTLSVVTSKITVRAEQVLEHFSIARFFDAVHGREYGQRGPDKSDLLARALEAAAGARARMAMVGDRREDMAAARAHGVRAVGAGWGYGLAGELGQADFVAPAWSEAAAYMLAPQNS